MKKWALSKKSHFLSESFLSLSVQRVKIFCSTVTLFNRYLKGKQPKGDSAA